MKKALITAMALFLLTGCAVPSSDSSESTVTLSFVPIVETIDIGTAETEVPEIATEETVATEPNIKILEATESEPQKMNVPVYSVPAPAQVVPVVPAETVPPIILPTISETVPPETAPVQTIPTNPPHEHSYAVTSVLTLLCTVPGEKVFTCSCGASYTEEILASHVWNQVTTEESGHWGTIACVCRCGWRGYGNDQSSAVAQYFSHVEPFGYSEERDNHSYDCIGENWIVDTPASTSWVCSQCGAVSDVQP